MEDLISRQAAIDVLTESLNKIPMINNTTNEMIRRDERITCIHEIIRLPSAEPKTGKWIVYKAPDKYHCGLVKCPFCEEEMIAEADEYNYCPNCGAKMVREEGEEE